MTEFRLLSQYIDDDSDIGEKLDDANITIYLDDKSPENIIGFASGWENITFGTVFNNPFDKNTEFTVKQLSIHDDFVIVTLDKI